MNQLEDFTCIMYGYPRVKSLKEARAKMLQKMVGEDNDLTMKSKVDFSRLTRARIELFPIFIGLTITSEFSNGASNKFLKYLNVMNPTKDG